MRSDSLTQIELGIAELEKYIDFNSACNRVVSDSEGIANPLPESISKLRQISVGFRRKKIFEYNSYIISLYGLFERFIENILEDYLRDICLILKTYTKLPSDIKKNLLNSNLEILKNLSNPKFSSLSTSVFIHNIHKALSENQAIVNIEAFQHHPYNFRQSIISDYFSKIGINGISNLLKIYEPLKGLLESKYGNPAQIESDVIFRIIDDLAQRRNDVAHGVENVELLNGSIIKEFTEFLKTYCRSLYQILLNERNKFLFNESESNFTLISVFNHSIICGIVESISISKLNHIIVEKPEGNFPRYVVLSIQDIQINKESHQKLNIIDKTNIGIMINGYVKDNYKFKIITTHSTYAQ